MPDLTGYRTIIVMVLSVGGGIAANHGFSYDASTLTDALLGALGALGVVMRAFTKTPVGVHHDADTMEKPGP